MPDTSHKTGHRPGQPATDHDDLVNVYGSGPLPVGERSPATGNESHSRQKTSDFQQKRRA